ncbi:hypothetical protein ACN38_g8159 [Penicillium nordicum]|uniref:Uncharacterized protein n=1 Tax=Penicillium nordicum TaxID=229535 RepID=A0A0M8NWS5_9EURO|nr:hypothetical protein ACN38_g8159 [Penicillium nordicum]
MGSYRTRIFNQIRMRFRDSVSLVYSYHPTNDHVSGYLTLRSGPIRHFGPGFRQLAGFFSQHYMRNACEDIRVPLWTC